MLVYDRGLYQLVPDYGSPARSSRLFSEGQHYVEYRAMRAVATDVPRSVVCRLCVGL